MTVLPDYSRTVYTGISNAKRSAPCLTVPSSKPIGVGVDGGSMKHKSFVRNATWRVQVIQTSETWQVFNGMGNRRGVGHVYRNAGLHALSHGRQGLIVA